MKTRQGQISDSSLLNDIIIITRQYHSCPNDIVISKGSFKHRFPKHLNDHKVDWVV